MPQAVTEKRSRWFGADARALAAALLVMGLALFAVFANGAYFIGPMTLCVVSLWVIFLVLSSFSAGGDYLANWSWRAAAPALLLTALWVWSGVSLAWSISPDLTLTEFNRTGGYLAVFGVGILLASSGMARKWAPFAYVGVATVAALYGIGPKALPAVVDNLENAARIAVPIGYANAMGLLLALAVPLTLQLASSRSYHGSWRLLAALSSLAIMVCLFFTASRGALLALTIGLAVYFVMTPLRLRSFGVFVLELVPTAAIAWWASGEDALTKDRMDLVSRIDAAAALRLYLGFAFAGVALVFIAALFAGRKVEFPARMTRAAGMISVALTFGVIVVLLALFLSAQPSIGAWARQAYQDFTAGAPSQPAGAGRLVELGSSGRWTLWREAVASWEDNPIAGSGAESFPLIHLELRESDQVFVKQAHGLGFSLLSELGIVGFGAGAAFIAMTMFLAGLTWCRRHDRWERGLAAGLIALMVIYLVHTSFDWDWNMFGLTMIFFFFAGMMAAWPASVHHS